ncbi:hypothetical protein SAMN04515667_1818 [Formosa sp. Hel1_31_208]|uniref:hypothetical protein n=1 Tax=Formosa sp. Hel1_31_208 TaxID=1798225 RepID=UPI0008792C57|nr:hypothetical protein [Formosa sp. Hel1_31_208]SDS27966.1 hypothetical protein SAMN04515667_1818 [Formosa sp. Hel1_31_208]
MKKICLYFLCLVGVLVISCEDEPFEDDIQNTVTTCEIAIANTAQAALNFLGVNVDNYTQLCTAYRNALQAQIDTCGDADGSLQASVDGLGDCSNNNQQAAELEGTWLLTAWIGEEAIDLNNDGTPSLNFLDELDCYENETIVFDNDGTAVIMSTSFADISFEIIVGTEDEYSYTIACIEELFNSDVTWAQIENTVTISDEGMVSDWTLNGNELSTLIPAGFFSSNEDGSVIITQDLILVYTKQ